MNGSQITLIGNLTSDPTLRTSNAGNDWATFRVAVNKYDPNAQTEPEPMFYDVKVFKSLAVNVCSSLSKGDRVVVVGDGPYLRTYTDNSGTERNSFEVIADAIGAEMRFATVNINASRAGGGGQRPAARNGGGQGRSGGSNPADLPGYGDNTTTGVDDNPFAPSGSGYDPDDEPF